MTPKSQLHIDGRVEGDVRCLSLFLGDNSEIKGNVMAEEVMGSIRWRRVILQSTALVEGGVLHKDLAMEQGAHFEGKPRRSDHPLSAANEKGEQTAVRPQQDRAQGEKDKASSTFVRTLD